MNTNLKIRSQSLTAFILLIVLSILLALLLGGCYSKSQSIDWQVYHANRQAYIDQIIEECQRDTIKWNAFLECSKYQGDSGCDSCFQLIYGFPLPE